MQVPPLRERRGDIPLLAESLLARIRRETRQAVRHISEPAVKELVEYAWPGNVRELENSLTRAAILARGSAIGPEHLSLGVDFGARAGRKRVLQRAQSSGKQEAEEDLTLATAIARHVSGILRQTGGNKGRTARLLGISRSRLQRYVEKFEMEPDE